MNYKLKITVNGIKNIDRTIIINKDENFDSLHIYIQEIFWLQNIHMYDFKYKEEFFVSKQEEPSKPNFAMWVDLYDYKWPKDSENFEDNIYSELWIDEDNRDIEELASPTNYDSETTKLFQIFENPEYQELDYLYDFNDYRSMYIQVLQKNIDWENKSLIAANWWNLIEDCWWPKWYEELLQMIKSKKFDEDLFETAKDFEEYIQPIQQKPQIK